MTPLQNRTLHGKIALGYWLRKLTMSDRLRLAFDWVDAGTAIRTCSNAVTMRFARDPSDHAEQLNATSPLRSDRVSHVLAKSVQQQAANAKCE